MAMKNLIYCAMSYWIIVLISIIIGVIVFFIERRSKFSKGYFIFLPIACAIILLLTIPYMKDIAKKEVLYAEVYILSYANHGLLDNYITEDKSGNQHEFMMSRFLYQDFGIEEGKQYRIYYFKNSTCIEHAEVIE